MTQNIVALVDGYAVVHGQQLSVCLMKLTPSKVITRRIEKILGFFQRESEAYAKLHHCFWFRTICKLTIFDSLVSFLRQQSTSAELAF